MCVVFLYVRTPKRPGEESIDCPYAAVVAVNRDESYTRDTARLHWWPQDATADPRECARDWQILAGRDREGGGTWCGVSRDGRVAVLTNVAEASAKFATGEAPSRGELPVAFLEASGHLSNLRSPAESIIHLIRPPEPPPNRPPTHFAFLFAGETPASTPCAMARGRRQDGARVQRLQPRRRRLQDRRVCSPHQPLLCRRR